MSTTSLTAGEVMDRAAALLNDPGKTDYTYVNQLPYLNMAIDELIESLEESNFSPTNHTSAIIVVPASVNKLTPIEHPDSPHYPMDLVEIQEVSERLSGNTNDSFVPLARRDFLQVYPANNSLIYWHWEDQMIKFNPNGAITARDVQLKYVRQAIQLAVNETSTIGTINSRSYLAYKTAAFCAMFIGENESRAAVLEALSDRAMERINGIHNKGKQQIMTRHRPFRASYKARGY